MGRVECRKPLRGGLFAHVLWMGDRLGRAAAAAGRARPISGVLCGSAAGLAEEWPRALRLSSTSVPNPVGSAQPATSVAGPSFAGRSGHDRGTLAATPRRSDALRPPPNCPRPSRRRPRLRAPLSVAARAIVRGSSEADCPRQQPEVLRAARARITYLQKYMSVGARHVYISS